MKANLPTKIPSKLRKALVDEVNKQTAENVQNLSMHLQALVLWSLHQQLGFGKKRLLKFQKAFLPLIEQLQEYYEAKNADETEFICLHRLKHEVGIDVEQLDQMFTIKVKVTEGEKHG